MQKGGFEQGGGRIAGVLEGLWDVVRRKGKLAVPSAAVSVVVRLLTKPGHRPPPIGNRSPLGKAFSAFQRKQLLKFL